MENDLSSALKCTCCKAQITDVDKFCGACGFPLQGTAEEQKKFRIDHKVNELNKKNALSQIKNAQIILFVISGFMGLQAIVVYLNSHSIPDLILYLIIGGIFIALGFWAKKKAFPAILTGSLVYIALILLFAFIDPVTIFYGIIFKVIFISAFIKGAYGAYKYKI